MIYKGIIADDEKELRTYLKGMLAETWPQLEICGEAANGKAAMEMIDSLTPHIAFLDIKMPGISGLDVAKKIAGICRIVFITAFDQYAVEAFEREAVDYLVKPVTKERLLQTINRLKKNNFNHLRNHRQILRRLLHRFLPICRAILLQIDICNGLKCNTKTAFGWYPLKKLIISRPETNILW